MNQSDKDSIEDVIQSVIREMMDRVMENILYEKPFSPETHRAAKPLYAALVPDEIFKGSHFERRFVTPFGKVWEKLAVIAAEQSLGFAQLNYKIHGTIRQGRLNRLTEILNRLEYPGKGDKRIYPNWNEEITSIAKCKGKKIPVTVVCDVYAENQSTGQKYAF